jgi:hypothetical protein
VYDRRVRRLIAILAIAHSGCDRLLNLETVEDQPPHDGGADDGMTDDAFAPKDCSLVAFSAALPPGRAELDGKVAGDPTLTEDSLELYFVRSGIDPFEIWHAGRQRVGDVFEVDVARAPFNIPGYENSDPSLTADGTLLIFVGRDATNGGPKKGYQVTRQSAAEWTTPAPIPGLESATMESVSLSWDGLTIYFARADYTLMQATRATRMDPFGTAVAVADPPALWPTVSADGLEMFYSQQGGGIFHARRTATDHMFGTITNPLSYGADPFLMPNSTNMWVTYQSDQTVAELVRECP